MHYVYALKPMTKDFYKKAMKVEVLEFLNNKNFFRGPINKYLRPNTNAIYLIRKMQLLHQNGKHRISEIRARMISFKLMKKYGIYVDMDTTIGLGFTIPHPTSICITYCSIGENFKIYQNCTIGAKTSEKSKINLINVNIGNNFRMYANSLVIGNVSVCDNVVLGANSCLVNDATAPGRYIGTPAKILKQRL